MQLNRARFAAVGGLLALALHVVAAGRAGAQPATPTAADAVAAPVAAPSPDADADAEPRGSSSNLSATAASDIAAYADSDHVFVFTPSISGSVSNPTSGWNVTGQYLVDVVSAASVDIVSTASRRWEEVRHEGAVTAAYKPGTFGVAANAFISREPDYLSLDAGGSITQDLLAKNLTWLFGYNYGHDTSGRTGTPFSVFSHEIARSSFKGGLTLLLDHATIASFIGDVVFESGDTSKPYRYIPLFAPGQSVPIGAPAALVTALRVSERPLEQLPLSRDRFALSAQLAHRFKASTLRVDERLYVDSWGLKATSSDARYLVDRGRVEFGPHVRMHAQSPVDFWQRAYVLGPNFTYPALRTGDREHGPLVNLTGGGSIRVEIGPATHRRAWVLGFDANATWTRYLDDLFITYRISFVSGVSLEAEL